MHVSICGTIYDHILEGQFLANINPICNMFNISIRNASKYIRILVFHLEYFV